jgi:predicted membrane protein
MRTNLSVVTLLFAQKASFVCNILLVQGVLEHNGFQLILCNLVLLTVSRLVTLFTTSVTNNVLFWLSWNEILNSQSFTIAPLFLWWKIRQDRQFQILMRDRKFHMSK